MQLLVVPAVNKWLQVFKPVADLCLALNFHMLYQRALAIATGKVKLCAVPDDDPAGANQEAAELGLVNDHQYHRRMKQKRSNKGWTLPN